tara:strand:+ start:291 stop:728 length:438 start_codon:yes stop_codon:yes gene_type:complete
MKAVVQRVARASVLIEKRLYSTINSGVCVFLGVSVGDSEKNVKKLAEKISRLRIFPDESNYMNKSIIDIEGDVLVVSQFTLYADCKKGNRPSFQNAANKLIAMPLYELFINLLKEKNLKVKSGKFGSDMQIKLENSGPITLIVEQ